MTSHCGRDSKPGRETTERRRHHHHVPRHSVPRTSQGRLQGPPGHPHRRASRTHRRKGPRPHRRAQAPDPEDLRQRPALRTANERSGLRRLARLALRLAPGRRPSDLKNHPKHGLGRPDPVPRHRNTPVQSLRPHHQGPPGGPTNNASKTKIMKHHRNPCSLPMPFRTCPPRKCSSRTTTPFPTPHGDGANTPHGNARNNSNQTPRQPSHETGAPHLPLPPRYPADRRTHKQHHRYENTARNAFPLSHDYLSACRKTRIGTDHRGGNHASADRASPSRRVRHQGRIVRQQRRHRRHNMRGTRGRRNGTSGRTVGRTGTNARRRRRHLRVTGAQDRNRNPNGRRLRTPGNTQSIVHRNDTRTGCAPMRT